MKHTPKCVSEWNDCDINIIIITRTRPRVETPLTSKLFHAVRERQGWLSRFVLNINASGKDFCFRISTLNSQRPRFAWHLWQVILWFFFSFQQNPNWKVGQELQCFVSPQAWLLSALQQWWTDALKGLDDRVRTLQSKYRTTLCYRNWSQ